MINTVSLRALSIAMALTVATSASCWAGEKRITANEASSYIGQSATVCGNVASTKYAYRSKGQPTFLNLDEPYPRQIFTVLVWGKDRPAFGAPETTYAGKSICVTGAIKNYRGKPEIIVRTPSQIFSAN
jgi:DNA/RNA endonuclease YhcR with UshA esterase domain